MLSLKIPLACALFMNLDRFSCFVCVLTENGVPVIVTSPFTGAIPTRWGLSEPKLSGMRRRSGSSSMLSVP